jgi:putative sugar O-methyltransferase
MSLDWNARLEAALEDMSRQDALYRPTPFWAGASAAIAEELRTEGFERFRASPIARSYFVPTHGTPGNAMSAEMIAALHAALAEPEAWAGPAGHKARLGLELFTSGRAAALADHGVVRAADDPARLPALHLFSESTAGQPLEQFELEGRRFSRSSLNYLLGLAMLKRHLRDEPPLAHVLEIGGGFGTLGEILASARLPGLRYVDLDIPPTSTIAELYLRHAVGEAQVSGHLDTRDRAELPLESLTPLSVLGAWQIEQLRGRVDLFVNFISFQEMEPPVVRNYLHHVDRLEARWVLLRNLREGKQRRTTTSTVGVDEPILRDDYLAMLPGYALVEASVVPFGYRTVDGFHSEVLLFRRRDPEAS